MLYGVLNGSWKHPEKQQLYTNLTPISQEIKDEQDRLSTAGEERMNS